MVAKRPDLGRGAPLAPGPIETDMLNRFLGKDSDVKKAVLAGLPARRAGTVDEIAQTIVFLASDKARYLGSHGLRPAPRYVSITRGSAAN